MFIWKMGLLGKRNLGNVSFCKKDQRWEVSLRNKGKGRVFWAKSPPFFLLPPDQNRGREWGASAAPISAARGSGVAPEWGRREREAREVDSRPQLGRRWPGSA